MFPVFSISINNKEFQLIEYFMNNPDRILSREQIYDRVWGMNAYGDTATVTVHLNRIRDKIEDDSDTPRYLQTIWGAGYRFRT